MDFLFPFKRMIVKNWGKIDQIDFYLLSLIRLSDNLVSNIETQHYSLLPRGQLKILVEKPRCSRKDYLDQIECIEYRYIQPYLYDLNLKWLSK